MNDYTSPCPTDDTSKKRCTKCGKEYPLTFEYFYHHKKSPDGYYPQCKICKESYRNTPKGKESTKRKVEKWRKTENGKAFLRTKTQRRAIEVDPRKRAARRRVNYAVRTGRLKPIKECVCRLCGNAAQEYHHWSYEKEHRLDVIPLCHPCHTDIHASGELDNLRATQKVQG